MFSRQLLISMLIPRLTRTMPSRRHIGWTSRAVDLHASPVIFGAPPGPSARFCKPFLIKRPPGRTNHPLAKRRCGYSAQPLWSRSTEGSGRGAWSPEQIARRLPIDFPDDNRMRISHEAIYQAFFVQGRGALRRELTACLRTGRVLRVPRARVRRRGKGFVSPEIMVSQRPAEAADRAVPGHWERDLILGLGSSAIGTLVERTTRFTMLLHLPRSWGTAKLRASRMGLRSRGTELKPNKIVSRSMQACRSTSAIRKVHGSAALTRTLTGCCVSTSRKAQT